jgi:hypothetical protein
MEIGGIPPLILNLESRRKWWVWLLYPRKELHVNIGNTADMVAVVKQMDSVSVPLFKRVGDDFMKSFTTKILYSIHVFSTKLHTYPIGTSLILLS